MLRAFSKGYLNCVQQQTYSCCTRRWFQAIPIIDVGPLISQEQVKECNVRCSAHTHRAELFSTQSRQRWAPAGCLSRSSGSSQGLPRGWILLCKLCAVSTHGQWLLHCTSRLLNQQSCFRLPTMAYQHRPVSKYCKKRMPGLLCR